jgi:hypothetical protein
LARSLALLDVDDIQRHQSSDIPALSGSASGFFGVIKHGIEMAFNSLPSGAINLILFPLQRF